MTQDRVTGFDLLELAAALAPAVRAARLSAVQAIATGRAPRASGGYAAHRLLGWAHRLPMPVIIGLAGPFARPGRTLVTLAAIVFGVVAVTFAVGLGHATAEPVQVSIPGVPPPGVKFGPNGPGSGPGAGPGADAVPAWPPRSARCGPRWTPSPARCTTWPKPTTRSASSAWSTGSS